MKTHLKNALVICTALSLFAAGCSKQNNMQASIVGAWAEKSIEDKIYIGNTVFRDTTVYVPSGVTNILTFAANGFFTESGGSSTAGGAYKLVNNTLSLFDTSSGKWYNVAVSAITANNLTIIDTVGVAGDTAEFYIQTFTR